MVILCENCEGRPLPGRPARTASRGPFYAARSAMPTNVSQSIPTLAAVMLGAVVVLLLLSRCINILRQYERGVVFRLGRAMQDVKGPGFVFIFWPIDTIVKVSLRVVTWDVPTQDVIT